MSLSLITATAAEAPLLAALHDPKDGIWTAADYAALLENPAHLGLVLIDQDGPAGFCLAALVHDEAEVIQIAVDVSRRRQGLGRQLLQALSEQADARAIRRLVLEVAADNTAAIALYQAAGLHEIGRRPRYYRRGVDAVMMDGALPLRFRQSIV